MITLNSEKDTVACPNDHINPRGADICDSCGLPIIDFDAELGLILKVVAAKEKHLEVAREKLFMGIGDQGCKIIDDFRTSWGTGLKGTHFLMIASSDEAQQIGAMTSRLNVPSEHNFRLPSCHILPLQAGNQVGYYGLGERLASDDPDLNDYLRRAGIRASVNKQTIFIVSALGGGTGSGASPYILRQVKEINPNCRSLVAAVMPAASEPDSAHFNTFCSLSAFLGVGQEPPADMILLFDYDRLMRIRGVGSKGEELSRDMLLSRIVETVSGADNDGHTDKLDPGYLAKMSRSMGIHTFVPCIAAGHSLEIFGSLSNIMKSAVLCPLAPLDKESVMISFAMVQIPESLASSFPREAVRAELNKWNRDNFPGLRSSIVQLSYFAGKSDRINLCLLLGGTKLAVTARTAKAGYERFKSISKTKSWEQEFGSTVQSLVEIEEAITSCDSKLDEISSHKLDSTAN